MNQPNEPMGGNPAVNAPVPENPAPAADGQFVQPAAPVQPNAPAWQPQGNPNGGGVPPYQPQQPYPQGYPVRPPRVPRRGCTSRDSVMAVLVALMSFILVECTIWPPTIGAGFAIGAVVLFVVEIWYLRPVWRHTGFYTAVCILLFVLGSVSLVFSADTGTKVLTVFCLITLYVCVLMDGMDLRLRTPGTFRSIADFFYTAFGTSFGKIGPGMYGLFHREKNEEKQSRGGFGKALLGLLIALPVALILLVLLSSADQAFQGMLKGIDFSKLPRKIWSLFLAAPMFILLFSQLFSLQDIKRTRKEETDKGIDSTIVTFFLLGVSIVYVAYLFSQLAYFFSGFMGFLPDGFTYAEYARRGFFELTAVSVINIVIVILSTTLSRRKDGKLPLAEKLALVFLCLFSLVLVWTELSKMKMYMDTFGLTRLRILTTLFMVFLAFVFLALMIHVFVRKFPYLKVAVIVGVLLTVAINFVSVDRLVADYNVWAYQSQTLKTVDVRTITELGDAAVPALIDLAGDSDPEIAKEAQEDLYRRWKNLHKLGDWDNKLRKYVPGELESYDFRGYNLVSYQARQLLLCNEALFVHNDTNAS